MNRMLWALNFKRADCAGSILAAFLTPLRITLDGRAAIERELSLIEAKQVHLVDAIAAGDKNRMILDRLKAEETRREELIHELERMESAEHVGSLDEARFKRELKARLADMRGLLARHVSLGARQLLKTLLEQPLRFEKVEEEGRQRYRIVGTGSYLPLVENAGESLFPGAWCPQRDISQGGRAVIPFSLNITVSAA